MISSDHGQQWLPDSGFLPLLGNRILLQVGKLKLKVNQAQTFPFLLFV